LRVESVRENRVEAVRIRDHDGEEDGASAGRLSDRPVEEAASLPRRRERE
jgi:hypothetical protein